MRIEEIRELPDEFDFYSTLNPFGLPYHAKRQRKGYYVTWAVKKNVYKEDDDFEPPTVKMETYHYTYTKEAFEKHLLNNEFVVEEKNKERNMSLCEKTEKQLEEVYQRNLHCKGAFGKKEAPELYEMCKNCDSYSGSHHDYSECRDLQCFKNWLGLEYLDWINGYGDGIVK